MSFDLGLVPLALTMCQSGADNHRKPSLLYVCTAFIQQHMHAAHTHSTARDESNQKNAIQETSHKSEYSGMSMWRACVFVWCTLILIIDKGSLTIIESFYQAFAHKDHYFHPAMLRLLQSAHCLIHSTYAGGNAITIRLRSLCVCVCASRARDSNQKAKHKQIYRNIGNGTPTTRSPQALVRRMYAFNGRRLTTSE